MRLSIRRMLSSFLALAMIAASLLDANQRSAVWAGQPITAGAFSPDGTLVVLGSRGGVEIRDWPQLSLVERLESPLQYIHDIGFSSDDKSLMLAGGSPAESGDIEVWDWIDRKRVLTRSLHSDVIYRLALLPDGNWITASADSTCKVVDAQSLNILRGYEGHSRPVLALAVLPHSSTVVSMGVDQTIRVWDGSNGTHGRTLDNHTDAVNALAVKQPPVNKANEKAEPWKPLIATVSEDRTVRIWQPNIGRMVRFVRLPTVPRAVVWSTDGEQIYVGCDDGHVLTLDANTLEILHTQTGTVGRINELVPVPQSSQIVALGMKGFQAMSFE